MTGASKSHRDAATTTERVVFVIDDDMAMRETLSSLFRSVGLRVELFGSTREFTQVKMPDAASCLVLAGGLGECVRAVPAALIRD